MTEAKTAGTTNRPVVTIKLASTSDELMQCYMLRAAVFMGEQHCPYGEEFDGNDYTASHVIMYVDGEPAGSMRLRWFQSFCKFERCVVLRPFRGLGIHHEINAWCKEFARRKGYTKVYLHLQRRHMPMMEKEGFRRVDDRVFNFSDHEYYAVYCELEPVADAVTGQRLGDWMQHQFQLRLGLLEPVGQREWRGEKRKKRGGALFARADAPP